MSGRDIGTNPELDADPTATPGAAPA
jgi:hypothetical protein